MFLNEFKALDDFWRHHKYGILTFLGLFFTLYLTFTVWLWLPILFMNLFTTFPVTFYIINYTSLMNRPIKFIWHAFFELMARTQKDINIGKIMKESEKVESVSLGDKWKKVSLLP